MKKFFIVVALNFLWVIAAAQVPSAAPKKTIYILPDGSVLAADKLDSLNMAWGDGRIIMQHNQEDDAKGIVHLLRMTDKMKQKAEDQARENKHALQALINTPAPGFELVDLGGNRWSLQELHGKIIVLNFWFTNCAPCIREMPELNKLVEIYVGKNVVFLGLTYNDTAQVGKFLKQHSFSYTLLPGSGEVDKKYKISTWPTSIVIDKSGYVKFIINSDPKIQEKLAVAIDALK